MKKGFSLLELIIAIGILLTFSLLVVTMLEKCSPVSLVDLDNALGGLERTVSQFPLDEMTLEVGTNYNPDIEFKYSGYKLLGSLVADLNKLEQWQLEKCIVVAKNENAIGIYDWYLIYPTVKEDK